MRPNQTSWSNFYFPNRSIPPSRFAFHAFIIITPLLPLWIIVVDRKQNFQKARIQNWNAKNFTDCKQWQLISQTQKHIKINFVTVFHIVIGPGVFQLQFFDIIHFKFYYILFLNPAKFLPFNDQYIFGSTSFSFSLSSNILPYSLSHQYSFSNGFFCTSYRSMLFNGPFWHDYERSAER